MRSHNKKIEQILNVIPIILSVVSVIYILIFCCGSEKESEILNNYSKQLNQNIQNYNFTVVNYKDNLKTDSFNKDGIIISDTKYIAIKKLHHKKFSVVLF
jgi:hypothetical protein